MQICQSMALFCSRLFCCFPTRTRQTPQPPSSQQRLDLKVEHLTITKMASSYLEFSQGSSKTRVFLYECSITFSDGNRSNTELTRHKICQLIQKFPEISTTNQVEEIFEESLIAESVFEQESAEIWLHKIHSQVPASPSQPSLERMDDSNEGITLESIMED